MCHCEPRFSRRSHLQLFIQDCFIAAMRLFAMTIRSYLRLAGKTACDLAAVNDKILSRDESRIVRSEKGE